MNTLIEHYLNDKNKDQVIYGYALKLCSYDKDKTHDLINDILLKILEKNVQFDESRASKTTLLCTIIKNRFLDILSKKRENFNKVELLETDRIAEPTNDLDVNILLKCLDKLKPRQKSIINLHIQGYDYSEIASSLNIPVGTVKSELFRIRVLLKKKMIRLGFDVNY